MTRKEAMQWLHNVKWMLVDQGLTFYAGHVEDIEYRLPWLKTHEERVGYARHIIRPGKRGHIQMVLHHPYEVRVLAWLVGMLRSIED